MIIFEDETIQAGFSEKRDGDLSFYSLSREAFAAKWKSVTADCCDLPLPAYVQQIHTDNIFTLNERSSGQTEPADAIITSLDSQPIGVFSADCLPVLLYGKNSVAAIHAGWRGTQLDISGKTADKMIDIACEEPESIKALIGPCIRPCCLEMGEEVYQGFIDADAAYSSFFVKRARWFLDLQQMNRFQLLRAGVPAKNIRIVERCTFCESEAFFSFRRQKQRNGSMFSFIARRKY